MRYRLIAMLVAGLAAGLVGSSAAQDADATEPGPWKYGATLGLNLAQSSFSKNWAGGDMGSINWVLGTDLVAERQFSRSFNLTNNLLVAYGQTSRQIRDPNDPGETKDLIWDAPEKTTDLIQFESTGRWSLHRYVDPYFSIRLDTQFNDESDPLGNILFNPIKLKETAGIARLIQKTEDTEIITRLGFGFRQTFASSFVDAVTLEKESFSSNDGGFEWQTSVTKPILDKKVLYKGNLLLFQPIFYSKSDELEAFDMAAIDSIATREEVRDFWKATDISFQNTFTAEITKYLQVVLYVQWVYDKFDTKANVDSARPLAEQLVEIDRNIRRSGQFKQTLALGLTYRLF